jgi:hypothetical protein
MLPFLRRRRFRRDAQSEAPFCGLYAFQIDVWGTFQRATGIDPERAIPDGRSGTSPRLSFPLFQRLVDCTYRIEDGVSF